MHLWRVNLLIQKLQANSLSQHEKSSYLFTAIITTVFVVLFTGTAFDELEDSIQKTLLIMQGPIVFLGITLCIRANAAGDGKRVAERIICLTVPTLFRQLIYLSGIIICVTLILKVHAISLSFTDMWLLAGGIIEFFGKPLFFLALRSRLKQVSTYKGAA